MKVKFGAEPSQGQAATATPALPVATTTQPDSGIRGPAFGICNDNRLFTIAQRQRSNFPLIPMGGAQPEHGWGRRYLSSTEIQAARPDDCELEMCGSSLCCSR